MVKYKSSIHCDFSLDAKQPIAIPEHFHLQIRVIGEQNPLAPLNYKDKENIKKSLISYNFFTGIWTKNLVRKKEIKKKKLDNTSIRDI